MKPFEKILGKVETLVTHTINFYFSNTPPPPPPPQSNIWYVYVKLPAFTFLWSLHFDGWVQHYPKCLYIV